MVAIIRVVFIQNPAKLTVVDILDILLQLLEVVFDLHNFRVPLHELFFKTIENILWWIVHLFVSGLFYIDEVLLILNCFHHEFLFQIIIFKEELVDDELSNGVYLGVGCYESTSHSLAVSKDLFSSEIFTFDNFSERILDAFGINFHNTGMHHVQCVWNLILFINVITQLVSLLPQMSYHHPN